MIKKSKLQKNAFKFNRKKQRELIIKGFKRLEKIVEEKSKEGKLEHGFSHNANSNDIWLVEPAFRLFRLKHKDLQCRILKNSEYTYFEIAW
jgi:hypothetical protein